ncbi:hypothetical protein O6H91_03G013400 [Diphasiastrum complanatum]|uniref:Uncharacterized protein n=1 Tax=Diphasiastrum complanatum TaxID=34168 RepID=A0ACC2E3N8_DIPCM|nr:hypothetical protein O6H91_03G013400 [Diphasiastrum complanatum]
MRGCRLRIADTHPSKVVKALLEPQQGSDTAAFLLADGSCVLVSLAQPSRALVRCPKPCSDACFLRLQIRMPSNEGAMPLREDPKPSREVLTPLKQEVKSFSANLRPARVSGVAGVPQELKVEAGNGGHESSILLPEEAGNGSGDVRPLKQVALRSKALNGNAQVCFVTASPAKGGACTDIHAWLCEPPSFVRMAVNIHSGGQNAEETNTRAGKSCLSTTWGGRQGSARLDVPHGIAVKMVASVNVIALYSASAAKIWVMAAKISSATAPNREIPTVTAGLPELHQRSEIEETFGGFKGGALKKQNCSHSKHLTTTKESLLLIKCAVLDCNRPIYSLHLSLQHLLLGEQGGVRVWPLRPLVKPRKMQRGSELLINSAPGHENERTWVLPGELDRHEAKAILSDKAKFSPFSSNGLYERAVIGKGVSYLNGFTAVEVKKASIVSEKQGSDEEDGLETAERQMLGSTKGGNLVQAVQKEFALYGSSETVPAELVGLGLHDGVLRKVKTHLDQCCHLPRQLNIPVANAAVSLEHNVVSNTIDAKRYQEIVGHLASPEPLSKEWQILKKNGLFAQHPPNVVEAKCKHMQHLMPASSPHCAPSINQRKQGRQDSQSMSFFIPLDAGKKDVCSSGVSSQVAGIQRMSSRDFIILDSTGQLHHLTLPKVMFSGENMLEKIMDEGSNSFLGMRPLKTSLKVKSFAVLPPLQAGSTGVASPLQVVFSSDRVHSLIALSGDTILTLTEKSIITYVIPAT